MCVTSVMRAISQSEASIVSRDHSQPITAQECSHLTNHTSMSAYLIVVVTRRQLKPESCKTKKSVVCELLAEACVIPE